MALKNQKQKAHEADKKTDSIEEPKKKVNDKNQQKSGIEHIHKNNTSSSKKKNHNKYKTTQKVKMMIQLFLSKKNIKM